MISYLILIGKTFHQIIEFHWLSEYLTIALLVASYNANACQLYKYQHIGTLVCCLMYCSEQLLSSVYVELFSSEVIFQY